MAEKTTKKKKTTAEKTQSKKAQPEKATGLKLWLWVLFLLLLSAILIICMYTPYGSVLGEWTDQLFCGLFGAPAKLLPLMPLPLAAYLIVRRSYKRTAVKAILSGVALWNLSALFQIFCSANGTVSLPTAYINGADLHIAGGFLGALATNWLISLTGIAISVLIYMLLFAGLLFFIFKLTLIRFFAGFFKKATEEAKNIDSEESYAAGKRVREAVDGLVPLKQDSIDIDVDDTSEKKSKKKKSKAKQSAEADVFSEEADELDFDDIPVFDPIAEKLKAAEYDADVPPSEEALSAEELMAQEAQSNQFGNTSKPVEALTPEEEADLRNQLDENAQYLPIPYRFPPTTLLSKSTAGKKRTGGEDDLRETGKHLVETLKSFGVDVNLLQVSRGPTVTRYELQPSVGVKVSKITNLSDDIALNLAAAAVRIEAPIPGKAAIGIEIPNKEVSMVSLRETLETDAFKNAKSKLAVALGMDITGNPIIADIAKFPHALIAGATGSGKSVCINSIITSILYKADPNEVKLMMIDPKVVELGVYNDIPHLLIPVVTDPKKASGALAWAVSEMTRRYNLFAKSGVRDLAGYNEVLELDGEPKLPQIVIIIDELADLMMVAPKEIEDSICRLAQMARAAGMYIIIATQRPSVNVITGVIKANIPTRIAFAVSSQIDSRTILDSMGAEKLLGKGDMLFMPFGASKPTRLQGAFVSDKEVESVVEFIKDTSKARYDEDITEKINSSAGTTTSEEMEDGDELLPKAIEIAIASGSISTSMIQRRLGVGYARAGRIIDQMEARAIISGPDGSKPRNVLVSADELFSED